MEQLTDEERETLVKHRLEKAKETLIDAKEIAKIKRWRVVANRLYYACFYAVSALLTKNKFSARSHNGIFGLFGLHFVSKGLVSKEQNKLYRNLFDLRQTGDYDDFAIIDESDIAPIIEPTEQLIETIENLINENN